MPAAWESAPLVEADAAPAWKSAPLVNESADTPPEPGIGHKLGLGVRNVVEGVAGPLYDLAAKPFQAMGLPVRSMSENLTALGLPEAQTPGERTASAIIEPVASTMTGMGIGRALTGAASPIVQKVGEALTTAPVTQAVAAGVGGGVGQATDSPTAGLAAGLAVPLLTHGAGIAGRAVTGGSGGATQADAALAQVAKTKYDIPITAPDLSNNSMYRIGADQMSKLPFSGAAPAAAAKQAAWQGAIAREMGEPGATSFTPAVMDQAKTRIGQAFDDVAARTSIPPAETAAMLTDMATILPKAAQNLGSQQLDPLTTQLRNIADLVGKGNGTITGDAYQALTRSKAPLDLAERSADPNVAHYAGMIRDALDDAFVRSAAPADQAALTQAKYQYRIMRTIDPLVAGSRDGNITPDAFMQKVLTASRKFDAPTGGMAYTGGGNIGELARIGKLMRAAPQTGTADRMIVNAATMGGAGLTALAHNPLALAAVPATLAANRGLQSYLRSDFLTNRLIDSSMNPQAAPQNALLTAATVGLQNRINQQRKD